MNSREIFAETVLFQLGPLPVTQTMVTSLAISLVLVGLAVLLARAVRQDLMSMPGLAGAMVVEALDGLVADVVGKEIPWLTTFSGSLFLFIAGSNILGQLPGVKTPAASLATTSALAIVVFLAVPVAGIRAKGSWGYLRHYFTPNPLLFPLHLLSEFTRTFALSVRLFGNMMSGHLVVALLVALAGMVVPAPLMALDLLIGILQAYIFAILTTVYVGAAVRTGEE